MLVINFDIVTSTQEIAKTIMKENTVIVANEMTNGYGRFGRKWYAPPGGLWMTVILKKRDNPQILNLGAGVAVAKSLKKMNIKTNLKWPNDVLYRGKKLCGIIGETHGNFILLGIGINLKNSIPDEIRDIAINIPSIGRDELLPLLLDVLENEIKEKDEKILEEWRKYDITLGKMVKIVNGSEEIIGRAYDIDNDGSLILISNEKKMKIYAGDLRFI